MRGRTLMFWVAAAALVAAAGFLLFGGREGEQLVPGSEISLAAERTHDQGTSHMTMSGTVSTSVNGQDVSLTMQGSGEADIKHHLAQISMQMSLPPGADIGGDDLTIDEVFDNYVIYMRSPLFASAMPPGKEWASMDLNAVGKQLGLDFQQLSGLGANGDPSEMLNQLRAVSGQVENVGEEDVDGVATTHYAATVDLRRYATLADPADRSAVRESIQHLLDLGAPATVPTDVWVDGQHLVRRMQMSYTQDNPATGSPMQMTIDIGLSDFGEPVDIQVPSPSETIDMRDLMGSSYGSIMQNAPPGSG
jgi:hypothetical protein